MHLNEFKLIDHPLYKNKSLKMHFLKIHYISTKNTIFISREIILCTIFPKIFYPHDTFRQKKEYDFSYSLHLSLLIYSSVLVTTVSSTSLLTTSVETSSDDCSLFSSSSLETIVTVETV